MGVRVDGSSHDPTTRVGHRVRVRRERWHVSDAQGDERCRLLTLTGLGPENLHRRRRVLAPFEAIEYLDREGHGRIRRVGRGTWRVACRALLAREGGWTALGSVERADVEILPHQLEPALAVLAGLGNRVLLADGVGLGKTVEAAIILGELRARGAAERVLLLTPAGLRDQWAAELSRRFGQAAAVVDFRSMRRLAAQLPLGVNPWATMPLAIASIDYVKRPEVLPAVAVTPWDMIVVDEAHLVSPGSDRYVAVSSLCAAASFVVMLTATPHSGDVRAFDALCALGAHGDPLLVFRRTRADVRAATTRRVHRHLVRLTADEVRMHAALARYGAEVRRARGGTDPSSGLLLGILAKRGWSSAASLAQSLERRLRALSPHASAGASQLSLPLDEDGELDATDTPPDGPLTVPALENAEREREMLVHLHRLAARAAEHESKPAVLARLLARCRRRGERVIVFTEYRDTLLRIQRVLGFESVVLHGGMGRWERQSALDAFTSGGAWLLLSTDAGSEGLNLHHRCRLVVHVELPWNPTRLEQRIGRVDRIGQTRPIHVWCLVGRGTGEMRVIDRLTSKVDRARQDIYVPDPLQSSLTEPGGPTNLTPTCVLEATREARRVARARVLTARGPAATVDRGSLVSIARGHVRMALGLSAVLVVESTVQDTAGRRIASRVDALRLALARRPGNPGSPGSPGSPGRPRSRRCRDAARVATAILAEPAVAHALARENACDPAGPMTEYEAFWSLCLTRAGTIRRLLTDGSASAFQPGLFDRRADRAHHVTADEHRGRLASAEARYRLCEHQLSADTSVVTTVLVLLP